MYTTCTAYRPKQKRKVESGLSGRPGTGPVKMPQAIKRSGMAALR